MKKILLFLLIIFCLSSVVFAQATVEDVEDNITSVLGEQGYRLSNEHSYGDYVSYTFSDDDGGWFVFVYISNVTGEQSFDDFGWSYIDWEKKTVNGVEGYYGVDDDNKQVMFDFQVDGRWMSIAVPSDSHNSLDDFVR